MFYSLTGKLIHTEAYLAVVECGGVGYRCMTSLTTLSCLPPAGERVTLYTHLNVREDAIDLFGFYSMNELDAFKKLIGVSGVGPKSALAILSDMTPDRLALCIASGDAKSLTRAPGVGVKLAQRLILELKDKISKAELASGVGEAAVQIGADGSGMNEAAAALCTLGYSQSQAAEALAGLAADLPVDELIRQALKKVARL